MRADPIAAHSDDRSRHCLTLTTSVQPIGACGRAVRLSLLSLRRANLPPARAIRHRARRRLRDQTRILALSISLLRVITEGAGS